MKRAPFVVLGTVVGLAGVASFHTKSGGLGGGLGVASGSPTTSSAPTTTTPPTTSTPSTTTSSTPSKRHHTTTTTTHHSATTTTVRSTTTTVRPTTTTAPPTTTTTTAPSGNIGTHTATGPKTNYNYGILDVQVTVTNGVITDVTVPYLQDGGNPRSAQIDQSSLPQLKSLVIGKNAHAEELAIQAAFSGSSSSVHAISGATFTSSGFYSSLLAALKSLNV